MFADKKAPGLRFPGRRSGRRRSDGSGRLRYSEDSMAESRPARRFARIDRLPLRFQYHRRTEDGRSSPWRGHHRPEHGQSRRADPAAYRREALHRRPARRHPWLLHLARHPAPAPGHLALVPRPLRRADRPGKRSHRHHRLQGRPRAPDAGDPRPWRHHPRAQPELSDPHLRCGDRRRPGALGAAGAGHRFLQRAGTGDPRIDSQAAHDDSRFPPTLPRSASSWTSSSAWWRWPSSTT